MRIAIVLLLCIACGKKADSPPAASGSDTTPHTGSGSAAPSIDAAADVAKPDLGAPVAVTSPIAVSRSHKAGQRYKIHMERSGEFGLTTFDGTATVKSAAGATATFDLAIEQIASPDSTVKGATLEVEADFGPLPHADARQTGGASVDLYLTPIEHMMGDICSPPKTAHLPGDTWTENITTWKFVAYTSVSDGLRGTFEGTTTDKWRYSLSLSPDDGFTGTCTVVDPSTTWKIVVTKG